MPFKVVAGQRGKPIIVVRARGEEKRFHPAEVLPITFLKMKETPGAYLGSEITDAVVTVPAYSNEPQWTQRTSP